MADKKNKKAPATFGSIALQNYTAQRGYEVGQDTSLGETLKPAVNLLGEYAKNAEIERGKFLSGLPDDFKVELLPASGKEAFTNFASDAKQRYSDAAGIAAKYSANPNSEQYRNAVKDMESIKGNLSNSFDSYSKLADLRQGYINNEQAKNKPIAMNAKDEQIYTAITEGDYENFENTADGLVYNYTDPITKVKEIIPFNELPNTKFVDSEMSTNVIASVLKNPYAAGAADEDMETSLSNANNEVQKLINTPEGYRQAVFNGFDGPKTKFIDYYVGEQFITGLGSSDLEIKKASEVFRNGINDINDDGKITKDDMQNGVWSFKEGDEGNAARIAFENKITDHKNDPDFDVKTQLSEFMNGIAKDKYLEGQANKFKNKDYNLRGIGERNHDQIQGDFDKLNNHEPISNYGKSNEFFPVEGKPGLYFYIDEDGKTRIEVTRDTLEKALDIFSVRGDFNTDPAKATTTATTDSETTTTTTTTTDGDTNTDDETTTSTEETVNEVDGATGATIKVDPPEVIEYEEDDNGVPLLPKKEDAKEGSFYVNKQKGAADYGKGYKFENGNYTHVETVTFDKNGGIASRTPVAKEGESISDVDYTNQTEEAPIPRSSEIKALKATLKDIKKQANSNGLTTLRDPKLREDIEEQIRLSDSYIKAVDDAYMNTGIINEEGVMRRGIPFISNTSFGGRGDLHKNYNSEKKRNKRLKEKYENLPEPVGSKEPVATTEVAKNENVVEAEVNNAPKERMDIDGINYNEETSKDVRSTEVITKMVDLPELEQRKLKKIEEKEGWEFEGYIPTIGSGITVGYGIDLSQPPYDTAEGLKENGFSQEFIDMAVKEGVLGKTWKELKADGKDVGERDMKDGEKTTFIKGNGGTDFLKQFQIPNSEQEKIRIYNLTSKNTEKQVSVFEDVMPEDVLLDYFTIAHWGGAGLSDEKYDKLYNGGAFGTDGKPGKISSPSNRKAFVVTTLNRKLKEIKEEKGKISKEDYTQALKEARDIVPNFVTDSPGNASTIERSIASISGSNETQA